MDPMTPPLPDDACCPEFAALNRRSVLRGRSPSVVRRSWSARHRVGLRRRRRPRAVVRPRRALAARRRRRHVAGGAVRRSGYYTARPTIAIPQGQLLAARRTAMFGLHPSSPRCFRCGTPASWPRSTPPASPRPTAPTSPRWRRSRRPTRVERPGRLAEPSGRDAHRRLPAPGRGIVNGTPPTEISGPVPLMTIGSLDNATIAADDPNDTAHRRRRSLHTLWDHDHSAMGTAVRATLQATATSSRPSTPRTTARAYGGSDLGKALAAAARIIRGNVGTEVITVDQGDWDMHVNLGNLGERPDARQRPGPGDRRSRRSSAISATRRTRSRWSRSASSAGGRTRTGTEASTMAGAT